MKRSEVFFYFCAFTYQFIADNIPASFICQLNENGHCPPKRKIINVSALANSQTMSSDDLMIVWLPEVQNGPKVEVEYIRSFFAD